MDGCDKKIEKILIGVNIRMYEEPTSGIQNFIKGIISELIKNKKYKFIFFSTGDKKIEKTGQYVKIDSKLIDSVKKIDPKLVNILYDNILILKQINKYHPKIFFSPSFILPIYKPKNTFYITMIHDLSFLKYKHNPLKIYMNLVMYMKAVMPSILKRTDVIIVPSNYVKDELIKVYKVSENKIKVIREGKDEYYFEIKNDLEFLKLTSFYKISKNFLLTNTTNQERKNISGLILAYKNIRKIKDYQLIITGLLPEKNIIELNNLIKNQNLEDRIKFLGYVPQKDLRILYSYAKLFIFPSFEEGFGLPLLESISCNCLPICSNTGALPEIINNNKLMFDPKNINSMTKKIDEMLDLELTKINNYKKYLKNNIIEFTWQKSSSEYIKIFDSLVSTNL